LETLSSMIALVQRVSYSSVTIDGELVSYIDRGINILLGILEDDNKDDIDKLVQKIVKLRIFSDECGKMNLNIVDYGGAALVVSQFTLAGDVKKGNRPSFTKAKNPQEAKQLYLDFIDKLSKYIEVRSGVFGANMSVDIKNDGPVTFILDSKVL